MMLRVTVVTLFPELFEAPLATSILGRAAEKGLVEYRVVNLRDYAHDRHQTVDDYPYGGGAGMVLKPEPFFEALDDLEPEREGTEEVSVGDVVLSGGEFAALCVIDGVVRLLPGVLGDHESAAGDSFYEGLLSPPSYTRPPEYRGMQVPDVLLSGDHEKIAAWRRAQAELITRERRPDLWARHEIERGSDGTET
jgi:tRNA (guanine37-N1)-methyltransferase